MTGTEKLEVHGEDYSNKQVCEYLGLPDFSKEEKDDGNIWDWSDADIKNLEKESLREFLKEQKEKIIEEKWRRMEKNWLWRIENH